MKEFVPFVINSNICVSSEDIVSFDSFMDAVAGNTGNSYITWALLKELGCSVESITNHHIQNIYSYDFNNADRDIEIIQNECTHIILVLQDQIRSSESYGYCLPFSPIISFLRKAQRPILVAGLGSNSLSGYDPDLYKKLSPDLIKFLKELGELTVSIGVRGYFTEEILHNIGIDNVRVVGCPSYYETGRGRIINKKEMHDDFRYASSMLYNELEDSSVSIYLQDKQILEKAIIENIVYHKKIYVNQRIYDNILCGKYKIFSSMRSWKESFRNIDFFLSDRVHGGMVAMNSGVPVVVMNSDSRSREMCEYMNIPYFPDLHSCKDITLIFDKCDYSKMNNEYDKKLNKFVSFLAENDFQYNPLKEQTQGINVDVSIRMDNVCLLGIQNIIPFMMAYGRGAYDRIYLKYILKERIKEKLHRC